MSKLILGTVQLGSDYGINNKSGQPKQEEAFQILDYAYKNGINTLDTASAYGDSENIIGEYMNESGNEFEIATKLQPLNNVNFDENVIETQLDDSLKRLGKKYIDLYLIHDFKDIINNENLIDKLNNLKSKGKIKKIGISLYEPAELEFILENSLAIDAVQIPFNMFDSRWTKNNLLKNVKKENIAIYARSIFLQGLFFLEDEDKMNEIHESLKGYIDFIRKMAKSKNVAISQLAIDYVKSFDEIDGILNGCETLNQLQENICQFNKENCLTEKDKGEILEIVEDIPSKIIDPRIW